MFQKQRKILVKFFWATEKNEKKKLKKKSGRNPWLKQLKGLRLAIIEQFLEKLLENGYEIYSGVIPAGTVERLDEISEESHENFLEELLN